MTHHHNSLFFFIIILSLAVSLNAKVMMEYIGATGRPVSFDPVPISQGIDFHFILSFAIDADASGSSQNGTFAPYWSDSLTPDSVSRIKTNHPNVKVLASLAGWSLGDTVIRWYYWIYTQKS